MAGELRCDSVTGELLYSPATGQLALDCDTEATAADYKLTPCYEKADTACGDCTADTPKFITITIVDNHCTDCLTQPTPFDDNGYQPPPPDPYVEPTEWVYHAFKVTACSIAGTYVLPQTGPCTWGIYEQGSVTIKHMYTFEEEGEETVECDEEYPLSHEGTDDWRITVERTDDGKWKVSVYSIVEVFPCSISTSLHVGLIDEQEIEADCDEVVIFTDDSCYAVDNCGIFIGGGSAATTYPGDWDQAEGPTRCPGGGKVYTDSDLSAYVGKVIVLLEGEQEVCWRVEANDTAYIENIQITELDIQYCCDSCTNCCADDCEGDCA